MAWRKRSWPPIENHSLAEGTDAHHLPIALITVVVEVVVREPVTRFISSGRSNPFGLDAMGLDVMSPNVVARGRGRTGGKSDDTECRQENL
jgi:hypothetical protein